MSSKYQSTRDKKEEGREGQRKEGEKSVRIVGMDFMDAKTD